MIPKRQYHLTVAIAALAAIAIGAVIGIITVSWIGIAVGGLAWAAFACGAIPFLPLLRLVCRVWPPRPHGKRPKPLPARRPILPPTTSRPWPQSPLMDATHRPRR